ncbi:response regulator [Pseudoalteromonas sp. JBTF-M23]|uniref:Response regulator n=1 Tax=Pseudoalteromonas caenipelagi TaxID=2726988 RepID=A0A849VLB7_9GAMM|nr:response regulator [Pseudoalteromonas caenipelagi]
MSIQPFVNAKILIVEEQPLALSYMKRSLEQLSFRDIQFADNAATAKDSCKAHNFELIICSFDLTNGQDGYQLYEELKHKKLIRKTTAFIFVSAETSPSVVHSILELNPDEFLVKPFSIKELKTRIDRVLKRKHALKNIYALIDDGNDSKALKLIDAALDKQDHAYSPILLKLKGEILLRLKRIDDAKHFYKSALELQKFTWAKIGLIEALIINNEDTLAQRMLANMIEQPETRLVALDLLGKLEIKLNLLEQAQERLQEASQIAPRNIDRQKSLGRIASLNHDYESNYNAMKEIAHYAKNSIHDGPDVYLNAVRAGIDFALTTDQSDQIHRVTRQSQQYLGDLKKQFPDSSNQAQIDVLHARIHYLKDESKKARQLIEQLDDEPTIKSVDGALDKAKAFHELGFHNKAQTLFTQIIEHCKHHEQVSDPITRRYIEQQQQERKDITLGPKELNNHAVTQFKRGQLQVAMEAFSQAFRIMPKNTSIALNLLQCMLDHTGKSGGTFNSTLAKKCYKTLSTMPLDAEQHQRFAKLLAHMQELGLSID